MSVHYPQHSTFFSNRRFWENRIKLVRAVFSIYSRMDCRHATLPTNWKRVSDSDAEKESGTRNRQKWQKPWVGKKVRFHHLCNKNSLNLYYFIVIFTVFYICILHKMRTLVNIFNNLIIYKIRTKYKGYFLRYLTVYSEMQDLCKDIQTYNKRNPSF